MLIPESWNDKNPIPPSLKAYYEYHATIMEPWDGPASIVFSDGRYIGGTLDRNGLRPSRYVITKDEVIVMGSEVGVQVFPPEKIREKGNMRNKKNKKGKKFYLSYFSYFIIFLIFIIFI